MELYALIEACKFITGRSVTIYTESMYAFGIVYDFGTIWKHSHFLTSSGTHIAYHQLVSELLDTILLPKAIDVNVMHILSKLMIFL